MTTPTGVRGGGRRRETVTGRERSHFDHREELHYQPTAPLAESKGSLTDIEVRAAGADTGAAMTG
jgi:hypothetical protein